VRTKLEVTICDLKFKKWLKQMIRRKLEVTICGIETKHQSRKQKRISEIDL